MTELSPIQRHLEELGNLLAAVPDCQRILTEAEDHLVEAAADLQRTGLPAGEAEERAVLRFGDPQIVAARFAHQLKHEELMQSNKNVRGVRVLAALLALVAVAQSAEVVRVAGRIDGLFWLALLAPLVHGVPAFGLWHHRGWARKGLLVWLAAMVLWGAALIGGGLVNIVGVLPGVLIGGGIVTICVAAFLFRYLLRTDVRLQLNE